MKKLLHIMLLAVAGVFAQMELPTEYTPPQDIVSMHSDLSFNTAIELLSEYCVQSKAKPIYDPTKQAGPIGLDIDNLPWEKALQVILSRRGLWYQEKANFLEIMPMTTTESKIRRNLEEIDIAAGYREILIETVFFEASRRELAETGIDWTTFYDGMIDISAEQLGALSVTSDQVAVAVKIPEKLFGIKIDALLKLYDSNNIGNVLAQPRVVVTEGNLGKVQVGQDFSIKTRDFAGNLTDEFFSVGTILEVTPFILRDDSGRESIVLNTRVERSNAAPDVVSTIINKSEATSILQMYDGETTLIAGLYSTEHNLIRKGVPILRDLPWWLLGLRYLFGYDSHDFVEKELVIILRASILPTVYERHGTNMVLEGMITKPLQIVNPYRYASDAIISKGFQVKMTEQLPEAPAPQQETLQETTLPLLQEEFEQPVTENKNLVQETDSQLFVEPEPLWQAPMQSQLYLGYVRKTSPNYILINWQKDLRAFDMDGLFGSLYRRIDLYNLEKLGSVVIEKSRDNSSVASVIGNHATNIQSGDIVTIRLKN